MFFLILILFALIQILQGNFMFTVLKKNIREKSRFINFSFSIATKKVDSTVINTPVFNYIKRVVE